MFRGNFLLKLLQLYCDSASLDVVSSTSYDNENINKNVFVVWLLWAPQAKMKFCVQITYMLISPDTIMTNSIQDIWAAKNKRILFKILPYDLSSLKTRYD